MLNKIYDWVNDGPVNVIYVPIILAILLLIIIGIINYIDGKRGRHNDITITDDTATNYIIDTCCNNNDTNIGG